MDVRFLQGSPRCGQFSNAWFQHGHFAECAAGTTQQASGRQLQAQHGQDRNRPRCRFIRPHASAIALRQQTGAGEARHEGACDTCAVAAALQQCTVLLACDGDACDFTVNKIQIELEPIQSMLHIGVRALYMIEAYTSDEDDVTGSWCYA